jgi:hypothetical protein
VLASVLSLSLLLFLVVGLLLLHASAPFYLLIAQFWPMAIIALTILTILTILVIAGWLFRRW